MEPSEQSGRWRPKTGASSSVHRSTPDAQSQVKSTATTPSAETLTLVNYFTLHSRPVATSLPASIIAGATFEYDISVDPPVRRSLRFFLLALAQRGTLRSPLRFQTKDLRPVRPIR